ncbi:flagellar hook-basal body complex protein FliE [Natronobacillus azotifigens]|uniref:Flagellar hook-basal body complex protein FliE n=1 Tax=Natronobacillus azotifigens TaxID=472978 RepID=A0A9J6RB19_9BACI|nr:flagellar hook-basal body complex protein FliE [Natronobacillus azotifigens]MCZ0702558.1 flagellar hook-basal body complex protein FliE [Natronobacillus azotifigens]
MGINLQALQTMQPTAFTNTPRSTVGEAHSQFSNQLKNAIEQLNQSQIASEQKTIALVNGEIDDLHDVMITAQKASITMNMAVEMQSKVIDAYNEIMRMQI